MLSVKVEDYGETEDQMHYVTYRATIVEDGDLLLNIFYSRKFFPFASDDAHFKLEDFIKREEIEMTYFIASFLEDMK